MAKAGKAQTKGIELLIMNYKWKSKLLINRIWRITGKPVDINSSGLILIFYKNGDIIKKYK
jgi:hypothetical protein